MTEQEIFDKVATHLLTQMERATKDTGEMITATGCYYRLERDGKTLKCAAGCLISDEDYSPSMEGKNFCHLEPKLFPALLPLQPYVSLIADLQYIHDMCTPDVWSRKLRELATLYNLSPSILETLP